MSEKDDRIRRMLGLSNESGSEEKEKIPKEAVLYMLRPETQYNCDKCVFSKNDATLCTVLGPTEAIKPSGSCGFWIHGDPTKVLISWIGLVTKLEAGYDENPNGFSCKRCEYFISEQRACEKVRKDSPGDTPGEIHPNACCNRWEADDIRAKKTTEQLMKLLKPNK